MLTHCGLVTPYGDIGLGQHWVSQWLVVWWYQAIYLIQCWFIINGVLWHSHERTISKTWLKTSLWRLISLDITHLKLLSTFHYNDVIMDAIASQITSLTIVYSTVYSDTDQRKHQSSASLVFVWGIHRGPVNSPHKWPKTRKMFPFDDVIILKLLLHPPSANELNSTVLPHLVGCHQSLWILGLDQQKLFVIFNT